MRTAEEMEQLEKDAARYRLLRSGADYVHVRHAVSEFCYDEHPWLAGKDLDRVLDEYLK